MIRAGSRTPQALAVGTVPAVRAFLGRVLVWPETAARTAIRFFEGIYKTELEFVDESGERWFDGRLASTYQSGHRICGKQDAMGFLYAADDSRSLTLDSQPAEIPITQVATKSAFDAAEQNLSAGAGVLLTGEPAAVLDPDGNQVGAAYPLAVRLTAESDTWNGARRWWIVLGNFTNGVVGRGSETVRYRWTWNDTTQSVAEPGFFIGYVGGDSVYRGAFLYGYQAWPEPEPGVEQMTVQILLTAGTTVSGWATQESETCIRIDWGDGTTETPTGVFDGYDMYDVDLSHTFTAGTYTVRFSKPAGREGTIRQLYFGGSVSNRDPIAEIDARGGTLGLVRGGAGIHTLYTGDNSVGNNYYAGCTALETAEFGQPQSIGNLAFDGCTGLGPNLEIPAQSVGIYAFRGCTGLRKVWIRETVTQMGDDVFYGTSPDLVVYCEADAQPGTWNVPWNETGSGTTATVVWGQKTRPW